MDDAARLRDDETTWWSLAVLACVIALAALLRFHALDSHSIWLDEAASWQQASGG